MKRLISILFYIAIGFILIGMIYWIQNRSIGNMLVTLGLLGILIYFSARTIKDVVLKRVDRYNIFLQIFTILMSLILFSKYLYHLFGDYPGILIIPFFIETFIFYLIKGKIRYNKLTLASITYLLLSIPLFGLDIHKAPRQYIPKEWYNRYDVEKSIPVTSPYSFKFKETENLCNKATDMRKSKDFYSAIMNYRQALKIEPKNPRLLFDISECYAKINDLETAIAVLDTAIMIDSTYTGFYNNRGLLYYKLNENEKAIKDYEKAIQIDSTQSSLYGNLALVLYSNGLFEKSCEAIKKAEKFGLKIDEYQGLKRIRKEKCK